VSVTSPARRWTLVGVAALVLAWVLAPAAVPIYDGAGFPDEPYRYVKPPAGAKPTPPPTTAKAALAVDAQGRTTSSGYSNSSEQGPQIVLYVPAGSLQAPAGAKSVEVSETPLAPSPPLPADGTIVTNVYRVAATSTGPVKIVGQGSAHLPALQMRAPSTRQPGPVFEHRTGAGWKRYPTLRIGQDIYQTTAPELGDWALVQLSSQPSSASGGGVNVGLLAAGIAVLVIAGVILAVRLSRSRRQA
jgi:hypothetical protein